MTDDSHDIAIPDLPQTTVLPPADRDPFLVYLATLPSPKSRRSMRSSVLQIARLLGYNEPSLVPWHELRYQHVAAIQAAMAQPDELSPATQRLRIAALRGVLQQAWKLGLMSSEDYHRAIAIKTTRGRRLRAGRMLSDDELAAMFAVVAEPGLRNARDGAILVLCCFGMRRDEVMGLDLSSYDRNTGAVTFVGKGNVERKFVLSLDGRGLLERWIKYRGVEPGPMILPINSRGRAVFKRCCTKVVPDALASLAEAARLKSNFTPHDLRRTFITRMLDSGKDISLVAGVVGHSSVNTTAGYDQREEAARDAATESYRLPIRMLEDESWRK